MLSVIVELRVRPDRLDRFERAIAANSRAARADEPGCLRFDVHRVAGESGRYVLYELYADEAAFYEDHRSAPHYLEFQREAEACLEPDGRTVTLGSPLLPEDIPEAAAAPADRAGEAT